MKILSAIDITKSIVEKIAPVITIDSYSYDAQEKQFEIFTCDTFYLIPCKELTIDGNDFTIDEVDQDVSIKISPKLDSVTTIDVTEFPIYTPFFFHGTPINVNNELTDIQFDTEKTPAVYLWETLREKHFEKEAGSPVALEFEARIFFLESSVWEGWKPSDHKANVIDPMKALVNEFKKVIQKDRKNFAMLEDFTTIERANFGQYQTQLGVTHSFFNDSMSGVELNITMKYKTFICEKNCV